MIALFPNLLQVTASRADEQGSPEFREAWNLLIESLRAYIVGERGGELARLDPAVLNPAKYHRISGLVAAFKDPVEKTASRFRTLEQMRWLIRVRQTLEASGIPSLVIKGLPLSARAVWRHLHAPQRGH